MKSICIILTSPFFLNAFLLGHIAKISKTIRVVVYVNIKESSVPIMLPDTVGLRHFKIRRNISIVSDFLALIWLIRNLHEQRFDAVWSITPKAGLLSMLSAFIVRVPTRIHSFTGQVWSNKKGLTRKLLIILDRVLAVCATDILTDSQSQKEFLKTNGIVSKKPILVIGDGSVSGVNVTRFRSNPDKKREVRKALGIPIDAVCLIFVGRMNRDKGIIDLLNVHSILWNDCPKIYLILVGPDDNYEVLSTPSNGVYRIPYTMEVESYMAAADIMCLPSYREGFGTVLIEAAACGLPAIASRIYGIIDAVEDGKTGLLHDPGDIEAMIALVRQLAANPTYRLKLGNSARKRATLKFKSERLEELFAKWLIQRLGILKKTI